MTDADAHMAALLRRFYNATPPQSPPVVRRGPYVIPETHQPRYTLPDGTVTTIPEAIRCGEATMRDTTPRS